MGESIYACTLFDDDGQPGKTVVIAAGNDADAILLANTAARDHPQCIGFEVRDGSRLVYMHSGNSSSFLCRLEGVGHDEE